MNSDSHSLMICFIDVLCVCTLSPILQKLTTDLPVVNLACVITDEN